MDKYDIRELIEKINRKQLFDFLEEYAINDTKFANAIKVRFCKPEFEEELRKIEKEINRALAGVSNYRNHDSWGHVSFSTSSIITEINQRVDQGHIQIAFAEIELLYRELLKNFEYQGECEISDEAEYCLIIMSEIADKTIYEEDKQYIFNHCIKLSELEDGKDYGADYEDELLKIAKKFATLENRADLDQALERCCNTYREEEFKLIQLELVERFEGKIAADNYISKNLQLPKIREIAFEEAMLRKDFVEGERLCTDMLAVMNQRFGISPWLYKLYSVYEMMKNTIKMAETAQIILLSGDLAFYDKLKSLLLSQGSWDNVYTTLLNECAVKLHYTKYMEILMKENEYTLLIEQLKKNTTQIYRYGKALAKESQADVCAIFTEQINKEAENANNRKIYQEVCMHIMIFVKAGYKVEATNMISTFKDKYRNRPAFVDELSKI